MLRSCVLYRSEKTTLIGYVQTKFWTPLSVSDTIIDWLRREWVLALNESQSQSQSMSQCQPIFGLTWLCTGRDKYLSHQCIFTSTCSRNSHPLRCLLKWNSLHVTEYWSWCISYWISFIFLTYEQSQNWVVTFAEIKVNLAEQNETFVHTSGKLLGGWPLLIYTYQDAFIFNFYQPYQYIQT